MLHRRAALNEQTAASTVEPARILDSACWWTTSPPKKETHPETPAIGRPNKQRPPRPDLWGSSRCAPGRQARYHPAIPGDWKAVAQMSHVLAQHRDGWSAAAPFASDPDDQSDAQSASNPGSRGDPALVASSASLRENGKTLEPQISVAALSSSPAPIFVVDHTMRITLWSQGERWALGLRRVPGLSVRPSMVLLLGVSWGELILSAGMAMAAPMLRNPVGCLLSGLPFVNDRGRTRVCEVIRRKVAMVRQTGSTTTSSFCSTFALETDPFCSRWWPAPWAQSLRTRRSYSPAARSSVSMAGLLFSNSVSGNDDDGRVSEFHGLRN